MPLFSIMGLLVPFYAGNFADKNLPGGESARVGLFASVMSFICTWAVRVSPIELSSRVVALTVAFVVMALGEDARDDSVPLGVYSVPGIKGESSGWSSLLSRVRTYLRQMLNNRQSRRIASFLLINFSFMGVEFVYGWWTNSLGLISDAVHMLFDCGALVLGLYGSLMSSWRPNTTYTYGYGRYEVLCGFANGVLLMVIAAFIFFEALGRLFEPPDISTDRLLVVSVCGFLVNVVGVIVFSDVGHGHSHGPGGSCPSSKPKAAAGGGHGHTHNHGGGCCGGGANDKQKGPHTRRLLDDTGETKLGVGEPKQALEAVQGYIGAVFSIIAGYAKRFLTVEGHDANMQVLSTNT